MHNKITKLICHTMQLVKCFQKQTKNHTHHIQQTLDKRNTNKSFGHSSVMGDWEIGTEHLTRVEKVTIIN